MVRSSWRVAPALVILLSAVQAAAAHPGDVFVCAKAARADGQPKFRGATVPVTGDRDTRTLDVKAPRVLCVPADVGSGVRDPTTTLLGYKVKLVKGDPPYDTGVGVPVVNALGELPVDTDAEPSRLLVPTATDPSADPPAPDPAMHAVDHYRCHRASPAVGATFAKGQHITVHSGPGAPVVFELKKLQQLCEPVDALGATVENSSNHLMCYQARRARGEAKRTKIIGLHVANELGTMRLDTKSELEICLPSRTFDRCNGFRALCDRAYDAVAYPTTHNAMSNAEDGWLIPNQQFNLQHQLEDGVRGMMLDTWYFEGEAVLCHAGDVLACDTGGMRPLVDGLADIKAFLDRHPNEIVSIIFESYISEADTEAAFIASGLIQYARAQPPGDPWPTLRELIEADTRLVVFTDDSAVALPWHHYVWDYAWETHYSFRRPEDFSCAINRGSMANSLFILNHFLTRLAGSPTLAEMVNHNPLFVDRAEQCEAESGRLPNFVTVDYYDIGDLFAVVDVLNGVGQ